MAAAATAQQTSDALAGVARQARKRADTASEVVNGFMQRTVLSQKIDSARAKLVDLDSVLQITGESMLSVTVNPSPLNESKELIYPD